MKIELNGETREVAAQTVSDLLSECGFAEGVATAVNEVFIPRPLRASQALHPGDRVEVLAPMQGG